MRRGILFVVSGPSGSGKGTICTELMKLRDDISVSVSATSRSPRAHDVEGRSYFFKTEQEFEQMIEKGELLEWVRYCDNYYGTPKKYIEEKLKEGINVILEIEVTGALNVKREYHDSVLIFVVPPKYDDLVRRLRSRGTENDDVINKRINKAIQEIRSIEDYDYLVVNDTIANAVFCVNAIIDAEKNKADRNRDKLEQFIKTLKEARIDD